MNIDITIKDASPEDLVKLLQSLTSSTAKPSKYRSDAMKNFDEERSKINIPCDKEPVVVAETPNHENSTTVDVIPETRPSDVQTINTAEVTDQPNPEEEVDSTGLPWDARIHASTKTKKKGGIWTSRRGVDSETIRTIEAELRNKTNPLPNSTPTFNDPNQMFNPTPSASMPPLNQTVSAPTPLQQPQNPAMTQTQPAQEEVTFSMLMSKIAGLFAQQRIKPEYVKSLVDRVSQQFGGNVNTIQDVAANSDMVVAAMQILNSDETNNFQV